MGERGGARPVPRSAMSEDNWDLRWPQSVRVFSKMAREDAQVKSVLKAVSLPILRTTWRVRANGADEALVRMVSEDLHLPVEGESGSEPVAVASGRVSWQEHLPWALRMLTYGHAYFEKVYTDGSDGPQRLRKLAPRLQDTITRVNVADDGGLESIVQRAVTTKAGRRMPEVELEVGRLLAYVHDAESMDWLGVSMLRSAYKHWRLKDQLLKLEADVLDRNGMGLPVYKSVSDSDDRDLSKGEELVTGLRSGATAGASIPANASLTIEGVKGQLVSPREAITYHDAQIARMALAHALNLEGKGGSYALAEVQMSMFIQSLQTTAEYIATVANRYLVEDMVEKFTGERSGPFPLIVFDAIGSRTGIGPEALAQLRNAGLIIPDKALEEHLRRKYELPAMGPDTSPVDRAPIVDPEEGEAS
ncbi:MAG: hypothetical protein Q4F65_05845 [Propionibacteriaceae bacterium]|nr:hypothetical protein [Propionibacteriaceae bacterium]